MHTRRFQYALRIAGELAVVPAGKLVYYPKARELPALRTSILNNPGLDVVLGL